MSGTTAIEWTDATWNPVTGCTKVSPGCDHCYAETLHERFNGKGSFATVTLHEDRLFLPTRWRKPRRVFVNSMSDLFHQDVPDEYIARVFAVMAMAPQHTFQILTKRHSRMRSLVGRTKQGDFLGESFADEVRRLLPQPYLFDDRMRDPAFADTHRRQVAADRTPYRRVWFDWPLPNVWLGVSAESQKWADIRIPALLETPAAVRFLSAEPLLEPINLEFIHYYDHKCFGCSGIISPAHEPTCGIEPGKHSGLDWVIVGGESGPGARPMGPNWVRAIRDDCNTAGVPFLFKQWGAWGPTKMVGLGDGEPNEVCLPDSSVVSKYNEGRWFKRVGKKAAGRELDGRTWDEYPAVAS